MRRQGRTAQLFTAIQTVGNAVALVRLVDALLQVGALELVGGAGDGRAALFVFVVPAVVIAVAHPRLRHAVSRRTAELVGRAGLLLAEVALVAVVLAVVLQVALPRLRDAAAVVALELVGVAGDVQAASLVAEVAAVVVCVALEGERHAAAGGAGELLLGAGWLGAVLLLVRVVQTVVVAVADPGLGDAALVGAGEVPGVGAGLQGRLGVGRVLTPPQVGAQLHAVGTVAAGDQAAGGGVGRYREAEAVTPAVILAARMVQLNLGTEQGLSTLRNKNNGKCTKTVIQ